ncbi:MAG: DUF3887 domain-containing protein [Phascolarctobacterium sp.]|nr:DUF3887 domain-containing protein [Phascolarctobacterium sp.]
MKKILTAMALAGAMSFSAICSAAGEGSILTKDQRAAEAFTAAVTGTEVTFASAASNLAPELKDKITEANFKDIQSKIKAQLGDAKEINFRAFEHFNDGDRVVYVGSFSKEKVVAITYLFNPQNKIINFAFAPVKPPQEAPKK